MQQNFIQNIKDYIKKVVEGFKKLDKSKKYAIIVGILAIILAIVFSISYSAKNKYAVLFSGLDTYDAANVSKALEDKAIETKIDGDTIYVPKEQVDKLRLELSPTITNGSKGFELMDEGSNISMTDEEFQIRKLRMLQGELEKTIKVFPQVENARVHITQGEESVFSKSTKEGKAAIYVALKAGRELEQSQIKSIISLVSASSINVPKQNIEVIDQNMNLLSEGIYDENGNATKGVGLEATRDAETKLNQELEKSVIRMLEPIFGAEKVKATVNTKLNFDTVEKNEIKIDPDKVIKSETRTENSNTDGGQTGSPVDNNMNNTGEDSNSNTTSKEEQIEYEVGRTETKTITASGDVKRITASVAIDGNLGAEELANIENMVSAAIGMDTERGDKLSVVGMRFSPKEENVPDKKPTEQQLLQEKMKNIAYIIAALTVLLVIVIAIVLYKNKKYKEDEEEYIEDNDAYMERMIREKEAEMQSNKPKELSVEDEVKLIVSKNPDEVTKLIKTWLND